MAVYNKDPCGAMNETPQNCGTPKVSKTLYCHDVLLQDELTRYFILWPGNDVLTISLITTNITNLPEYSALSYAWGPPTRTNAINVVDQTTKGSVGMLLVTANLRDALHKIRDRSTPLCIWADAICINQEDPLERNHQVKQMATIYSCAHTVLVWLGQDAFQLGNRAFEIARLLVDKDTSQAYLAEILLDSDEFIPSNRDSKLNIMRWLTERQWFTRIWCMQEIGLATRATILCGDCTISWTDLSSAYGILQHSIEYEVLQLLRFRPWLVTFLLNWKVSSSLSFLETLDTARSRFTSNSRDRIYAMLTHPSARRKTTGDDQTLNEYIVRPDYTQSVQHVYTDAAIQMILETRSLDPLSYIRTDQLYFVKLTSAGRLAMPSWVPDWREGRNTTQLFITDPDYMACGPLEDSLNNQMPVFVQVDMHHHLETMAIPCGTVKEWRIPDFSTEQDAIDEIRQAWHEVSAFQAGPSNVELVAAFGRVLCGGFVRPRNCGKLATSGIPEGEFISFWESLLQFESSERDSNFAGESLTHLSTQAQSIPGQIWNQISHACNGRKFFWTDTGYIGLGPSGLKKNDDLFVLSLGRVPLVLRRLGFEVPRYFLVGECYVDGLMHGEASQSKRAFQRVRLW